MTNTYRGMNPVSLYEIWEYFLHIGYEDGYYVCIETCTETYPKKYNKIFNINDDYYFEEVPIPVSVMMQGLIRSLL